VHVRHCPACRTDYRPDIVTCADCGALLADRDDELELPPEPALAPDAVPDNLPPLPEGFQPLVRASNVWDLTPLADRLVEEGIECRMREVRPSRRPAYEVLVHADDRAEALAVVAPLAAEHGCHLHADNEEAADPASSYSHCPSCGAALPAGACVCPECELELRQPGPTCPECGSVMDDPHECPQCGPRLATPE
jgi:hypothetical protein